MTLWRTMLRHLTLMYISQYPPPDMGNSFCLVVRIFGSEPKGPRFYPAAKVVTRADKEHATTFSPTNRWQHQISGQFHLLLHSPDGSTTQLLQQRISPNSKPMTHFIAQKACDTFYSTQSL
ncbi:hypothetical protein AVEN_28062-1 [Araneus ventricosus]|uniref:Uncharacterized protein n=1 Tax=Araneus ventricosus TaxID=182803 RepID=A0A4Y2PMF9_ARAVE|nr:hypothetical protein AVEN_28062-1 [Araneus ventricosus]